MHFYNFCHLHYVVRSSLCASAVCIACHTYAGMEKHLQRMSDKCSTTLYYIVYLTAVRSWCVASLIRSNQSNQIYLLT